MNKDFKRRVVLAAQEKGDAYLQLVHSVRPGDGILSEQIARGYDPGNRGYVWANSYLEQVGSDGNQVLWGGEPIGAKNLTWNDESLLSAAEARQILMKTLIKF